MRKLKIWLRKVSPYFLSIGLAIFFNLGKITNEKWVYYGFVIGIIWGILWTFIIIRTIHPSRYNTTVIKRDLWDIYDKIRQEIQNNNFTKLGIRCTVWVPTKNKEELFQLIPYIPQSEKKKKRKLHTSKGIIGWCYRIGDQYLETLTSIPLNDNKKFQDYMLKTWGFTREDVQKLTQDRRCYFAIPIIGVENQKLGVLYWDAKNSTILTDKQLRDEIKKFIPKLRKHLYLTEED